MSFEKPTPEEYLAENKKDYAPDSMEMRCITKLRKILRKKTVRQQIAAIEAEMSFYISLTTWTKEKPAKWIITCAQLCEGLGQCIWRENGTFDDKHSIMQ